MLKRITIVLLTVFAASLLCVPTAGAQSGNAASEKEKDAERLYHPVSPPTAIDRQPKEFLKKYVKLQDYFGKMISDDMFRDLLDGSDRRRLKREAVSPKTHYIFTTHATKGSNMICFVARDNEDAEGFFQSPIVTASQIHLLGKVSKRVVTDEGIMTFLMVDRIKVGHTPFETEKVEEKKDLLVKIEYEVMTPNGPVRRIKKYRIPEAGKEYKIPNPYNKEQTLYMTFQF